MATNSNYTSKALSEYPSATRPSPKSLGIYTDKPKFPHYAIVSKRLESFETEKWNKAIPVSVQDLAEAGFVFTGVGDSVRCYFCGGGLKNWESGEKPEIEHARWFPHCGHLVLTKGHKFINKVTEGQYETEDNVTKETDERKINDSCAVQALLEIGYTEEAVQTARKIFTHKHGKATYNAEKLCEILMDMEDNPESHICQETVDCQDNRHRRRKFR